jgi:hypothetical protein
LKVELTLKKTQFYFENVYAAEDIQFLRRVNWGQHWVKRHFSLEWRMWWVREIPWCKMI